MDCNGVCSSGSTAYGGNQGTYGAVYQEYYNDSDGDTFGSTPQGWMCSVDAAESWVSNQLDADDNCNCPDNNFDQATTTLDGACYDCSGGCIADGNELVDD